MDRSSEEPADLWGRIAEMSRTSAGSFSLVLVDVGSSSIPAANVPPTAGIIATPETKLFVQKDGTIKEATADEIRIGDSARVWTDRAEMRSQPPQFHARRIVIIHFQ